jgi:hypothetical protein
MTDKETTLQHAAHEYASIKAALYAAKFTRGVRASAVDAVYLHAYGQFLRRHAA